MLRRWRSIFGAAEDQEVDFFDDWGGGSFEGGRDSQAGEAEACFSQARDLARRQQAKALELRATVSLSRLWQHQGKRAEARDLLAPVYGWFTEGFDTADLQDARALLEALG